jgi:hypothetical protein
MAKKTKAKLKKVGKSVSKVRAYNKLIGTKVKQLSEERGGNTITLAKAIGITQAQVSRLQNGLQGFANSRRTTTSPCRPVI